MKRIFLSYSRKDSLFAERLARDLQDAGFEVWIDFLKIKGGQAWEDSIFKGIHQAEMLMVCLSPDAVESDWVRREIVIARAQHKFVIPVMLADCFDRLPNYAETEKLRDLQIVNFERFGYERAFTMLLEAVPGFQKHGEAIEETDPATIPNPFKGLEAFQQNDAHLFFGREDLTEKILKRLEKTRFLAVVGASGSGKSSLVRAGVIPALRANKLPGSEQWAVAIFTPGARPTEAMGVRLLPIFKETLLPNLMAALERSPESLHQLTEGLLAEQPKTARLVLVVDQFEEVFTRASQKEAIQFLNLIQGAATIPEGRTLVIVTLRADFFNHLSQYPDLAELFERENMVIATEMSPENLRQSIIKPAQVVGLIYEEGLPDQILEAVRQQPGSLPLLQFALKELYERREGRQLTQAAYEQIGGVRGALVQHADDIYQSLNAAQQDIMRRVLLRLVEVREDGEATRRKVARQDLTFKGVSEGAVQEIIDLLTAYDSRLLIASRAISTEEDTAPTTWLEVSHEALIREWGELKGWIAADVDDLHWGGELLKAAHDWDRTEQDAAYLLSGSRLNRTLVWLEKADANDLQRRFIGASILARDYAVQLEQERQAKERILALRSQQRLGYFLVASVLGLVVAITLASVAFIQWGLAQTSSDNAQTQAALAQENAASATIAQGQAQEQAAIANEAKGIAQTQVAIVSTNEAKTNFSLLEAQRAATLVDGQVVVPIGTQTPESFIPTLTQIALLNAWTPQVKTDDFGISMVKVPAGCFWMGSVVNSDEQPINEQCFEADFWIDQYEVTNAAYQEFILADGYYHPEYWTEAGWQWWVGLDRPAPWDYGEDYNDPRQPRVGVTWYEAYAYCQWRKAWLPTEAEWEYAARGPDSLVYPWGNEFDGAIDDDKVVWHENSDGKPAMVGSKPAGISWAGAYDLSGNVGEWVNSDFQGYPYDAVDGREDILISNRLSILRGGSFGNDVSNLRSSNRIRKLPVNEYLNGGLRCAHS